VNAGLSEHAIKHSFTDNLFPRSVCISLGTLVSSTNKTDHHDIAEFFLKVALSTTHQTINQPLNIIGCSTGITSKYYNNSGNKLSVKECLMACSDNPAFTHFAIQVC
jgi:hypothetical protein